VDEPQWFSISITVAPEATEAIEYAFNSLEALGTEIDHLRKKGTDDLTVVGYFDESPDEERVQDELHYALRTYGLTEDVVRCTVRNSVEDQDWLAEWKRHWKPTEVGGFVIAPPWSEVKDESKIVVRIDPNMAFGTGTHETTQLCIRAIEEHYKPGDSFLDVGTGTGILAIAAARLNLKFEIPNFKLGEQIPGPSLKSQLSDPGLKSHISNLKLQACDTDIDSIAIAKENANLNGVGGAIEFHIGSIADDATVFDLVCANLTLDVIEPILPLLIQNTGKTLILSGILVDQEGQIIAALKHLGISDVVVTRAGEWICAVTHRRS
jgi:ribosomal protein L11 methyltransferase